MSYECARVRPLPNAAGQKPEVPNVHQLAIVLTIALLRPPLADNIKLLKTIDQTQVHLVVIG